MAKELSETELSELWRNIHKNARNVKHSTEFWNTLAFYKAMEQLDLARATLASHHMAVAISKNTLQERMNDDNRRS